MEKPEFVGENAELCGLDIVAAVVGIGVAAIALYAACQSNAIAGSRWALAAADCGLDMPQ